MTWMRMPLFVWAMLTYAWLLMLALPTLSAGLTMMLLDRHVGTHFFDPAHGGSPILYQHVFWFFGHPEVYIMVLPAMGIISEIIPVFSRKPIFGYKAVAFSTVAIAFLSLARLGATTCSRSASPTGLDSFFMVSSMVIAVPTGVKIFNWLATTLAREHLVRHADAVGDRLHRPVHDRRALRDLPGRVPDRLAADADLLRRRAHPLRAVRRVDVRAVRRPLLLVAEDLRAGARRAPRQAPLLAGLRRLQPHLHAAALPRAARHAAARLHVLYGRALGGLQHDLDDRLVHHGRRHAGLRVNVGEDVAERARAPSTTRGSPTRSSGTRPRRRRRGTSTSIPYIISARPLRDLRRRLAQEGRRDLRGLTPDSLLADACRPGRGRGCSASGPCSRTGLAVVSGAADWDTAHRLLAALALPPLAALARARMGLAPGGSLPAARSPRSALFGAGGRS